MNFGQAMDKVKPILNKQMGGVCSFGFIGDNLHTAHHASVCHASVRNAPKGTEYYYSTVTPEHDKERFEYIYDFTLWALGDAGPWRSLVKDRDRAIVVHDDMVTGFVLEVRPDDPAAMIRNMCMALRLTGEHKANFDAYLRFRAEGLSEVDSFYIANGFVNKNDTVIQASVANSNHVIIPTLQDFHLKRFEDGNPYPSDEKLVGGSYSYGNTHRTTGVFRQKNTTTAKSLLELTGAGKEVRSRWTSFKLGRPFPEVARIYTEEFKPKYIASLAA